MIQTNAIFSYVTANDIAAQTNYQMTKRWEEGEAPSLSRFGSLLQRINQMGFAAIAPYTAYLEGTWASRKLSRQ